MKNIKKKTITPKLRTILHTCGNGCWSNIMKSVQVSKVKLRVSVDDPEQDILSTNSYYELKVFFTKKTWDLEKHGLIYTDELFIKELRKWFKNIGLLGYVYYTEQGMQGDNYVSCDVDKKFVKSWIKAGHKIDKEIYGM